MINARNSTVRPFSDRSGYTLIELMVSLIAASMLMVGMGAALVISTKALTPPGEQQAVFQAAETGAQLSDDLHNAIHVVEQNADEIEFALADRDDDGLPEVIRYEWDDVTEELSREFNGQEGVLLDQVREFSVSPLFRSANEALGGIVSESTETTLEQLESASTSTTNNVNYYGGVGHSIELTHPADTALWSITELDLQLKRSSSYQTGEVLVIRIHEAAGDGVPTSRILAETTIPVSSLSTSWNWETISITGVERLLPEQDICVVILGDQSMGGSAGRVNAATAGFSDVGFMLEYDYYLGLQLNTNQALYYRLRGTRHTFDQTSHTVVRNFITGYKAEMRHGDGTAPVARTIRLLNTPEDLSAVWQLDFNNDPLTGHDVDVDGTEDWEASGNTPSNTPLNNVLKFESGEEIRTAVGRDFDALVTAEFRVKGLGANATEVGAEMKLPFTAGGSNSGLLTISVSRDTGGNQVARVTADDGATGQTVALTPYLADDFVDLRVVIDPVVNHVAVWINGVFLGRSVVTQPLTSGTDRVAIGANGADAEFDYVSVRVGGNG